MSATLSSGQRLLLDMLAEDGTRIWRSPAGYQMVRRIGGWVAITEPTVKTLERAGYVRQVETYGRDRGLYEITEAGRQTLALTHA